MFGTTRLATAAVAGVLSLAVTGAAAFAAFQPPSETALLAATETGAAPALHAERGADERTDGEGLRAILARLVQSGTITQPQAEAILTALKEAAEERRDGKRKEREGDRAGAEILKRVLGNMLKVSVEHIGLPKDAVAAQLKAGKSLAEIAATQPGKSRDGLIAHVTAQVSAQLDQAVAEGKVTKARADEVRPHLAERVAKFVDHVYERKPQKERAKPQKERAKPRP